MNDQFTPGDDGGSIDDNVREMAPPPPPATPGIGLPETLGGYGTPEEWRAAKAEQHRRNAITGSIVVFTLAIAGALYSLAWQASLVWIALVAIVAAIELTND